MPEPERNNTACERTGRRQWKAGALLLFLAAILCFSRFALLDQKPMHHDESMFAHRAWHLLTTGDYNYEAILHGPFLEHITAVVFLIAGDSDATARSYSAVAGLLLIGVASLIASRFGRIAPTVVALLMLVSPTLLYYSRFNRNDIPFALAAAVFVWLLLRVLEKRRASDGFLLMLSMAWMICIKETSVIFLFILLSFIVFVALLKRISGRTISFRRPDRAIVPAAGDGLRLGLGIVGGIAAGLFLIVLLFTTFFRHPEHAGGFLEAVRYWAGQHAEQRIYGEFHYYIPILALYEFLPAALFLFGVFHVLRRTTWLGGWIARAWVLGSIVLLVALWRFSLPQGLSALLHMSRGWHLWLAIQIGVLGTAATAALVLGKHVLRAFFLWWTFGAFLAYSYAGEKVPWVTVHILVPMILFVAATVQDCVSPTQLASPGESGAADLAGFRKWLRYRRNVVTLCAVCLAVLAAFTIAVRLAFFNAADPSERLVYTHTTPEYEAMVKEFRDVVTRSVPRPPAGDQRPLLVYNSDVWPAQWYFRHWRLAFDQRLDPQYPLIVIDEYADAAGKTGHALERYPWLAETHVVHRIPFREWWRQDELIITFARLFDIWLILVPDQYRRTVLTDIRGRPIAPIGDTGHLADMTVADAIEASKQAWRKIVRYVLFREAFDPYRFPEPTLDHIAVLACVREDLYKQWLADGGTPAARKWKRIERVDSPP